MAKAVQKSKHKKERTPKYEPKLAIKGTFADVFKVVKKNKEEKKNDFYHSLPYSRVLIYAHKVCHCL